MRPFPSAASPAPLARRSPLRWLGVALLLGSCSPPAPPPPATAARPTPSNRIDVPPAVQQNLGITFATVERRHVAATLRLPAAVELLPAGRAEHRTPLAGRVEILVAPLQRIEAGTVLFRLDAPQWRLQQRELGDLDGELAITQANLEAMAALRTACAAHEHSLQQARATLARHVELLESTQQQVGGQAQPLAAARVQVAMTDAQLAEAAEKHTQIETRVVELRAQLRANRERWVLALAAAAATVGQPPEALAGAEDSPLHWRRIAVLEVRARAAGVVEHIALASGSWVDAHALVLTSVDPTAVRARAQALQSDLPRLRDELPTALVPAGAGSPTARVAARLQLAPSGDPRRRTLEVHATPTAAAAFVRPGAAVYIEITTLGSEQPVLAIPRSAVLQDGLQRVYFRRDPKDPDRVIRVEADLGLDDGRWIEVKSDLTDGDQVVITGAYELVLATAGQANKGGHFHADGTWHEDHE